MSRRTLYTRIAGAVAALFIGGLISGWFLVERMLSGPELKPRIEAAASQFLLRPLTIGDLEWRRWPKWKIIGRDVRLWEDPGKRRLLAESLRVEVDLTLLSFYRLAVGVAEIKLVHPRFHLREGQNGEWNAARFMDNFRERPSGPEREWGRIVPNRYAIEDGSLSVQKKDDSSEYLLPLLIQGRNKFTSSNPVFNGVLRSSTTAVDFKVGFDFSPRFRAVIDLKDARYHTASFQNAHAVVRLENGVYRVDRTVFDALGGSIAAEGSFLPSASTDSLKLSWTTSGIQAKDLFNLAGSSVEVSGILDSDGHIESGVGDLFLPSMNGEIRVDLKNGWFGNATGILKVLSKLNVTTLITEVAGQHRSRVPFNETHGTLKIVNGVASTVDPFLLENKTLQMGFMGAYDLSARTVDGKIVVNFLMVTDEIIHRIPIVRDILLGDKKGLVPIWLSVKGSAANPAVEILSGKSIASPVWNTISNIFHLPGKLFREIKEKL